MTSLLEFPEIRDRLIILNGWSKTYAMTGWRLDMPSGLHLLLMPPTGLP